jgi:hypothetical protein
MLYPPKYNTLTIIHINTRLAYSAKKKNTNMTAECSVIKPLTNSDSASARSKGALFVSAIADIKNIKNKGNKGIINHVDFWLSIVTVRFKLLVSKTTTSTAEVIINS